MSADRFAGIGALVLGVTLYALAGDSEAYLFPRIIALVIGALGLAITAGSVLQRAPQLPDASAAWLKILPVLAVFLAYSWTMEALGFYVSAFAAFLVIVWIYAPEPFSARVAAVRVAISAAFIAAIYALFSVLLNVQTPRGILL